MKRIKILKVINPKIPGKLRKIFFLLVLLNIACSSEQQIKDHSSQISEKSGYYSFSGKLIPEVPGLKEENVKFEKINLDNTTDKHSSLTIGPDGNLYASTIDGRLKRYKNNEDGTLEDPEVFFTLQEAYGERSPRLTIGFAFDPGATADSLVAWVTHQTFTFNDAPDWDGKISKLSGPDLEVINDVIIHLPRSAKDHLTNSLAFGPDGALYFTQGSNTAMGAPDKEWYYRKENLLSAAVLRLDISKIEDFPLPLEVKTKEGGGDYDPFLATSPLTKYATGIRNAYDLLWHSNGNLFVPINGSSAGGKTPASVKGILRSDGSTYIKPAVEAINKVTQDQKDLLYNIQMCGYYGHPNPTRGEFVMNGGNPTKEIDPAEVEQYKVGTLPDDNWKGYSFDFGHHVSPNGIIEYRNNSFNGALKGKFLQQLL